MHFLSQKCDILFLLIESAFGRSLKYIFIIMSSLNDKDRVSYQYCHHFLSVIVIVRKLFFS